MMEMDGRHSAKCQNPREGTWMTLFELLMRKKTKIWNSSHLLHLKRPKRAGEDMRCSELGL